MQAELLDDRNGAEMLVSAARQRRGRIACLAGAMAEQTVERRLIARGDEILARRWRGRSGEIDLICRQGRCLVFVEVKASSSHEAAAARLTWAQQDRICSAAEEYCAGLADAGWPEMRFDVALVDGLGRVDILENAFGDCFA